MLLTFTLCFRVEKEEMKKICYTNTTKLCVSIDVLQKCEKRVEMKRSLRLIKQFRLLCPVLQSRLSRR